MWFICLARSPRRDLGAHSPPFCEILRWELCKIAFGWRALCILLLRELCIIYSFTKKMCEPVRGSCLSPFFGCVDKHANEMELCFFLAHVTSTNTSRLGAYTQVIGWYQWTGRASVANGFVKYIFHVCLDRGLFFGDRCAEQKQSTTSNKSPWIFQSSILSLMLSPGYGKSRN